jgi:uncharacterized membrane protein YidH (DUF202 family)
MTPDRGDADRPRYPLAERATAVVLILVMLSLAAMALAAWRPAWIDWVPLELQVWSIVALLSVALVLVSVVALLHTRARS